MNWIWYHGSVFAKVEQSWERWWYEEHDHLKVTEIWGKFSEIISDFWFFFFQYGIVYQLLLEIIVFLFTCYHGSTLLLYWGFMLW